MAEQILIHFSSLGHLSALAAMDFVSTISEIQGSILGFDDEFMDGKKHVLRGST
jgi:hypothetical protein